MTNERLVLNFLVFADRVANGELQADLLQEIADLGFTQVEIRREYFKNIEEELPVIESEAKRLNMQLFYSVPDEVYISGEINPKLEQYLVEAKRMGVKHIKW
ncbi:MAG: sugar phosphate isomerase, partial [Enterococcus hulanensis]